MLEVKELCKTFAGARGRKGVRNAPAGSQDDAVLAVDHVSFDVAQGEVFTLLGPSGCGKSTTLRSVAGLEQPDSGRIAIGGRTVFSGDERIRLAPEERHLSMVFQSYAIWPHMNVFSNVAFPLEVQPRATRPSWRQIQERVEKVLDAVALGGLGGRSAVKLSGGQQQRLALARALVTDPELVLLDEPLSNLDAKLRESMRLELKRLQQSLGLTAVYVTHDQGEALALSSRIAVMNQGKIVQIGKPREIYETPNCQFVAEFIGTSNVLSASVRRIDGDAAELDTAHGPLRSRSWRHLAEGDEALVIIRPEDTSLVDADAIPLDANGWAGRVVAGAYLGEAVDHVVAVGSAEIRSRANPSSWVGVDSDVFVDIDPRRVHLLPPDGSG